MAERMTLTERLVSPEKSPGELYAKTLKLKREVLSFHRDMNSVRRDVNKRINEINAEEFHSDPEVIKYEKMRNEYNGKKKLFLDSFEKLNEQEREKLNGLTSLNKVDAELASLGGEAKIETVEKPEKEETLEEVEKMLKYAKDTGRLLELAYWESKKKELEDKYYENRETSMAEVNKMIEYSLNTGRPLELAYWESKKKDLKGGRTQKLVQGKAKQVSGAELEKDAKQEDKTKPEKILGGSVQEGTTPTEEQIESELRPEPKFAPEPEPTESTPIITLAQKDEIDHLVLRDVKESSELLVPAQRTEVAKAERDIIDSAVDQAISSVEDSLSVGEAGIEEAVAEDKETPPKPKIEAMAPETEGVVPKEKEITPEIRAPETKTLLQKIRERVKKKALVYVSAGLLTLMAWKSLEVYDNLPKASDMIASVLDKASDIDVPTELPTMVVKEAARYGVKPYLVARYVGSNDYFKLEAIKAMDVAGLGDRAERVYKESLDEYINNFSETRRDNRFTTLDKHTVRNYMDAFIQIYSGQEQTSSASETYQKFRDFLESNFGIAKAYEFALKVNSEKNISPVLVNLSRKDLKKQELILSKAAGRSSVYFNQEEGIFNIIHKGRLIDTYASRAGFMNVPADAGKSFKSLGYGRTPDGTFTISSVEYGYSTLRWKDSFLPYGSEIRLGESQEIEYKYHGKWYQATGPEATYFDQGKAIRPNKSNQDLKFLQSRSRGESPLVKSDFFTMDGLMERWDKNPFGPISYRLAGRAELIHSNPTDSDRILHPSHGCIRLDKEDVKVLEKYIGTGSSKIRISSVAGESWRPAS